MQNTIRQTFDYYAPHTLPFLLWAFCIYLGSWFELPKILLAPFQTILAAGGLIYFRKAYQDEIRFSLDWLAIAAGIAVFLVWILPEGWYPVLGNSSFNPYEHADGLSVYFLFAVRLIGSALVVPLAEELFWRSFGQRFLINSKFKSISLGQFTWFSFLVVSLAFGFEHHRWLVGIIAGIVYAGLLYRTKNLFPPILAHAITNLLLGIYVI